MSSISIALTQVFHDPGDASKMQAPENRDSYQYQSLPSHGWFRLLILEPLTSPDYRISCRLFRRRITSSKDYEALSYTWGTDEPIAPILLDGQVHRVRRNLLRALQSLRLPHKKRFLWIDALCINQESLQERADQVSQMGEIYSGAGRVVVWLGEGVEEPNRSTDAAMDCLVEFSKRKSEIDSGLDNSVPLREHYAKLTALFGSIGARVDGWKILGGISFLFTRDWWERVWTLQEVVLADRVVMKMGRKEIDWTCFEDISMLCTVYTVHTPKETLPSQPQQVMHYILPRLLVQADTVRKIRSKRRSGTPMPLSRMIEDTVGRKATNPRDKVYGVLGLIISDTTVTVNYNHSVAQVYAEAMTSMLRYFGDLRVYNYLLCPNVEEHSPEMPSWVPNLQALTKGGALGLGYIRGASLEDEVESSAVGLLYGAATNRHGELVKARMEFSPDGSLLTLKGIHVDRVCAVGRQAPEKLGEGHPMRPVLKEWEATLDQAAPSCLQSESGKDAFWRTVNMDCKIINHHPGLTLKDNPRDERRRLDRPDSLVPPRDAAATEHLVTAMESQAAYGELELSRRRFFVTEQGHMGMGPPALKTGDEVCVLLGGEAPFVLRPVEERGTFRMVGQCYAHGFMDGEAVRGGCGTEFARFVLE
ncbi:HET-domain-containing protein [Apiospora marii]|uniref:HET-domain-containing protein n=1 Tax=Apiospora marii TaxID=335849 RepID=A0ABR1S583_9PEZI